MNFQNNRLINLTKAVLNLTKAILISSVILFYTGCFLSFGSENSVNETVIRTRWINNQKFSVYRQSQDGVFEEIYKINEEAVNLKKYENALAEAVKQEFKKDRQAFIEKNEKTFQLKQKAIQRLIEISLKKIEKEIKKIQEYDLEDKLIWGEDTVSQGEYYSIKKNLSNRKFLKEIKDTEKACNYAKKCEEIAEKLNLIFFKTAEHLVENTTDTNLLKRLMKLL